MGKILWKTSHSKACREENDDEKKRIEYRKKIIDKIISGRGLCRGGF